MNVSGQLSGNNGKVQIAKGFGDNEHNVIGSAFAAGSTLGGPVTIGGKLAYNNDRYGLALSNEHVRGVSDIMTQSAHVNLINSDKHRVDVSAFASQNKFANGAAYDRNGAEVGWLHKNGHSASAGISHIPKFGTQAELGASANLWKSKSGSHSLDLSGNGSQWMSGPFKGQTSFGAGIGLKYNF